MGDQPYDILLKNGHVIDPANGIDGKMDVAISGSTVAAVEATGRREQRGCGCPSSCSSP